MANGQEQGKYVYKDGKVYEGTFAEDVKVGTGMLLLPAGTNMWASLQITKEPATAHTISPMGMFMRPVYQSSDGRQWQFQMGRWRCLYRHLEKQ
jgi:hypothetical protein